MRICSKRMNEVGYKSTGSKYQLVYYHDVWFNEDEGYQVNNLSREDEFYIDDSIMSNQVIVNYLANDLGFLPSDDVSLYTITGDDEFIEIEWADSGEPICRVEKKINSFVNEKRKIESVDEVTCVIFKKDKDGDAIAFFPYENEVNRGYMMSYQHVGQHSEASKSYFNELKPARPDEYKDLYDELTNIGYNLKVISRVNYDKVNR